VNKKIILIDDDELLCRELSQLLKEEGFEAEAYSNSELGLNKLLKNNYGLLLLDLKMPKIGGREILKAAKERGLKTKIIIITGNPIFSSFLGKQALNDSTDSDELGFADFIFNKPFDPELLLAKINELLAG